MFFFYFFLFFTNIIFPSPQIYALEKETENLYFRYKNELTKFFPCAVGSRRQQELTDYVAASMAELGLEYKRNSLTDSKKIISFSENIFVKVGKNDMDKVFILSLRGEAAQAVNIAAALTIMSRLSVMPQESTTAFLFCGDDRLSVGSPGSDYFINTIDVRPLIIYPDLRESFHTLSITATDGMRFTASGYIEPLFNQLQTVRPNKIIQESQLLALSIAETPNNLTAYLKEDFPALLLTATAAAAPGNTDLRPYPIYDTIDDLISYLALPPDTANVEKTQDFVGIIFDRLLVINEFYWFLFYMLVSSGLIAIFIFWQQKRRAMIKSIKRHCGLIVIGLTFSFAVFCLNVFVVDSIVAIRGYTSLTTFSSITESRQLLFIVCKILLSLTMITLAGYFFRRRLPVNSIFYSANSILLSLLSMLVATMLSLFIACYFLAQSFIFFLFAGSSRFFRKTLLYCLALLPAVLLVRRLLDFSRFSPLNILSDSLLFYNIFLSFTTVAFFLPLLRLIVIRRDQRQSFLAIPIERIVIIVLLIVTPFVLNMVINHNQADTAPAQAASIARDDTLRREQEFPVQIDFNRESGKLYNRYSINISWRPEAEPKILDIIVINEQNPESPLVINGSRYRYNYVLWEDNPAIGYSFTAISENKLSFDFSCPVEMAPLLIIRSQPVSPDYGRRIHTAKPLSPRSAG